MDTTEFEITRIYLSTAWGQYKWFVIVHDAEKECKNFSEFEQRTNMYCYAELIEEKDNGIISLKTREQLIITLYPSAIHSVTRQKKEPVYDNKQIEKSE